MSAFVSGASEDELKSFARRCKELLFSVPPSEYLDFLRICNGGAENGVFVYSTRRVQFEDCAGQTNDFVEVNLNWRDLEWMTDYLVFGDSDMDVFVLEISSGKYQVRDRQAFHNVYAEFPSFDGMMCHVIEAMLHGGGI
ncbi:SMI1/KNR4 family protein [Pseudomonas sp. MN1F]|nr:SMI1/KNR4 family protein [Pseudomonas sp. MN1F]